MRADALRAALEARRRPDDRLRPGGQRQHRRVRPVRGDRGRVRGRRRVAARRRRVRALGGRHRRASGTSSPGSERADSWATDCHKWLNVPYDSRRRLLRGIPTRTAPRCPSARAISSRRRRGAARDQMDWNPEFSRRARGFPIYAAIRSLGRDGDRGDGRTLLRPRVPLRVSCSARSPASRS